MATRNTPRGAQAPAQPAPAPAADEEEIPDDEGDEEEAPPAAPKRGQRPPRDEEESLLAAAKRKLGLPDDADPSEILRAVVARPFARPSGPPRAACRLPVVVDGKRVRLTPGDLIPASVDVASLPPHAVTTEAPKGPGEGR